MNSYLLAVILGVVEGLTEFLPVSSTAHLRLSQALMGLQLSDEYWKMFAIVIQLGAILSLFVVFRVRLQQFFNFKNGLSPLLKKVMVAFVVTAGPAFLLSKIIGHNLESLKVIGSSLLVGGIIMIVVDFVCTSGRTMNVDQMTWLQAIAVGVGQIFSALFPGTSRSMATIASGQIFGMARSAALEFSFLVSIPTMMAATGYDLLKTLRHSEGQVLSSAEQWVTLGIGFIVSFIVALGVVFWFLKWVRTRGFTIFGVYRIILGLVVLTSNVFGS